jgi:hypothetical protein
MMRILMIALAALIASVPVACFAQDRATGDPNKLGREEWQSRVNENRERLHERREELRRDREQRLAQKREKLRFDPESRIELKREELRREREKQKEILRERKGFIPPPPTQDEITEAASQRVLEDHLQPGDIVSTRSGLFRFRGSPNGERKPEDFERLR